MIMMMKKVSLLRFNNKRRKEVKMMMMMILCKYKLLKKQCKMDKKGFFNKIIVTKNNKNHTGVFILNI